ncbi:MAG: hypothetical protein AAGH57_09660 [Pseudomonadota bacterium]
MSKIESVPVPSASLLAEFGPPGAYRDCYAREVPSVGEAASLEAFVTRFYCSAAFRPERIVLGLAGHRSTNADAAALARGDADTFAMWRVIERREDELLLQDKRGATASWFSVRDSAAAGQTTTLLFGSWVGQPDRPLVKALIPFHRWYSRWLLGGV